MKKNLFIRLKYAFLPYWYKWTRQPALFIFYDMVMEGVFTLKECRDALAKIVPEEKDRKFVEDFINFKLDLDRGGWDYQPRDLLRQAKHRYIEVVVLGKE